MPLSDGDVARARAYVTRPDLCTVPGLIEWVEALADEVDRLRVVERAAAMTVAAWRLSRGGGGGR
jgi:hypothetical protein